ncbi:MAG TPA: tRNA (N(6)-L-threonylcarbamoyladenosine(37)-C(2))-methylthiotransferase MtaB [Leptospiraceae bacterium]|nr:tRNA (N(6)-L-threonylcarbamoyladenosine(37)-C(2))-methylthiotransferase MtaB [Leptospiraceae bacterium]HMW07805.1 tRNA (N(6)-L-threonylcarbamoyladenosine(37)-C(2))-methylthiotransferase MtaB [Leptospiraceae bacterium]HMY33510.1 tRNA (N(6)-L-threonylcarbamoyladenosine(37)-C(2))-methylthiotransferase MtaB [Leptospiraceae bacterium]HMZ67343.1 tRNA (N(6)-L-threonylcarbamoyladenosine(37)-C(2))-methylthiotransferase MtaB [Leptospiraceae bacterium]HNA10117.1 tRNA (N(6)-L-threonylcarbamoyladenosine(
MKESTVAFHTLGCRLNIFESDGLANTFSNLGIKTVSESENPEIVVINTCTVTNKADSKNRNIIRNAIKNNPGSQIWVTGCYAETDKETIEKIPGVTGVIGNTEKSNLPYIILKNKGERLDIDTNGNRFSYSDVLPTNHTRAYLKIQDGCNRSCAYCKIPQARGKGVSRNIKDVLDQVRFLQDNGVGEIILTGVNLGWFRDESNTKNFNALLKNILDILEYSRLRLSSIEPSDVGHELAELTLHPRFCNYLHVPLQSGSSNILKKMKRSYTAETFYKRISLVKQKNPSIFIGTDIITGFPNESEEDFQESVKIVKDLEISKIHAFPYSQRRGTLAETFPDNISKDIKKERVKILNLLSQDQYKNFGLKLIDKKREAILESDGTCMTDDYLKVRLESGKLGLTTGQFLNVKIKEYKEPTAELKEGHFLGEVC